MQQLTNEAVKQKPDMSSLRDIAELLVKHRDLHEGLYNLVFEFQISVGGVGPQKGSILPGAMIGISGIGLAETNEESTHTVDAAKVNPYRKIRKQKNSDLG